MAGATGAAVAATVTAAVAGAAYADPDWTPIVACESGGNPAAQNPSSTASGLFQFLDSSWLAYGGGQYAPRAKDATVAQQYAVASRAYAQSGLGPWAASRGCWASKGHVGGIPAPVAGASASPAPRHVAPVILSARSSYTVAEGDTLSAIADAHGVDGGWTSIWNLNKDVVPDPAMIYPGQTLRIP